MDHIDADFTAEFSPLPISSGDQPSPIEALVPLLDDPNALIGPSGEDILVMEVDGVDYHVPADIDSESATLTDGRGMNILADTDGDGRVDYVSSIDFNGNWSAWRWAGDADATAGGAGENGAGESGAGENSAAENGIGEDAVENGAGENGEAENGEAENGEAENGEALMNGGGRDAGASNIKGEELPAEQRKSQLISDGTPDLGKGNWDAGAWKCVERGEWG